MTNLDALFKPATKAQISALVALCGPTGSGKTFTALRWAEVLGGGRGTARIAVIDTENDSARLYAPPPGVAPSADQFQFDHLAWEPPYTPGKLADIVTSVSKSGRYDVLIIDSFSHFWDGEGGVLEIVDRAAARTGNSYTAWAEGTPAWRSMVDAIRHCRCHVIVCMRSEMKYVLQESTNREGRAVSVPTKIGLKPRARENVEYEFQVVADIDLNHRLTIGKTRCSLIADRVAEPWNDLSVCQVYRDWLLLGDPLAAPEDVDALKAMFALLPDEQRAQVKTTFVERFGKPDFLTVETYQAARAWTVDQLHGAGIDVVGEPQPATEDAPVDAVPADAAPVDDAPPAYPDPDPPTQDDLATLADVVDLTLAVGQAILGDDAGDEVAAGAMGDVDDDQRRRRRPAAAR